MNIKRGLKRIWIVVSVLWVVGGVSIMLLRMGTIGSNDPDRIKLFEGMLFWQGGGLLVWWGLLYTVFWIVSGFTNDKKNDETNE
jgi:hypothetical protein